MAKSIVVHCTPFDRNIQIYVLDRETQRTYVYSTNSQDLPTTLLNVSEMEQCNTVNIKGTKLYTKGIEKKIKMAEIAKYNENKLIINLVK